MRILFIGTVRFSRHCLKEILDRGSNVVAVFTMSPGKGHFNTDYEDIEPITAEKGIPVFRVKRLNDPANVQRIRSLAPDVIFVFGFSQIIGRELLDIPPLGCIGTHPTLLPKNRGRHPLIWTLIKDLPEGGLTFFFLDERADSGDIVWQRRFPVTDEDDAGTLYEKIMELAGRGIGEILPLLERGELKGTPQDHSRATYWPKRSGKDGEIDWSGSARTVWNLIRALARPYIGAHTFHGDSRLTVWRASMVPEVLLPAGAEDSQPGQMVAVGPDGPIVRTGEGFVRIEEWEGTSVPVVEPGDVLGGKAP